MNIKIFKPISFNKENFDINFLNSISAKKWEYAANGKSALYHCIKALNVSGKILVPNYVCNSILKPIYRLKLFPIYYDLHTDDLNPSVTDIEQKIKTHNPSCVLVVSLYGNPANLKEIQAICIKYNVKMIDDAAQCFGAKTTEGQFAGTFGNAGFFSFGPGKPTSGHMGAFYWTENPDYFFKRKKRCLNHFIIYLDYYFNRLFIYKYDVFKIFRVLSIVAILLKKLMDEMNDDICKFEHEIIGGIFKANLSQTFRTNFFKSFYVRLCSDKNFKLITKGNDYTNNHKLVLLFNSSDSLKFYHDELERLGIFSMNGYSLLNREADTPNANFIHGKILELPIEEDQKKMSYLVKTLENIRSEHI